jgi:heme exporter protein A
MRHPKRGIIAPFEPRRNMLHVDGLCLHIPRLPLTFKLLEGQILWVRGENGAGKSTLLKTLLGLSPAKTGSIRWTPAPPSLFYLAHDLALQSQLSVLDYCRWHPAIPKIPTPDSIKLALKAVRLLPEAHRLCGQLSRGQQQRLLLACALLSEAKLWVLDEPFTALDAQSRDTVLDCLRAHKARQGAAIVVSHYPIPEIADEVLDVLV